MGRKYVLGEKIAFDGPGLTMKHVRLVEAKKVTQNKRSAAAAAAAVLCKKGTKRK